MKNSSHFRIVQFTDLHLTSEGDCPPDTVSPEGRVGEGADQGGRVAEGVNNCPDAKTLELINETLHIENPDLVLFTGDTVFGPGCDDVRKVWRQPMAVVQKYGVPWASVQGNHDAEGELSKEDILTFDASLSSSLTACCDKWQEHYHYGIVVTSAGVPPLLLYMLDITNDRGRFIPNVLLQGKGRAVAAWVSQFRQRVRANLSAKAGQHLPALAFFHVPLVEYEGHTCPSDTCNGVQHERVCAAYQYYDALEELKQYGAGGADLRGIFVGHDHINDFCVPVHGTQLCYGRQSGFGPYGLEHMRRGARVIDVTIDENGSATVCTWKHLHLEDARFDQFCF